MDDDKPKETIFYLPVYGDVEIKDFRKGLILPTPDGTKKYRLTVSNAGAVVLTQL